MEGPSPRRTERVKTTLSKLGPDVAVRLVRHGYVLAMANLHVFSTTRSSDPAGRRFDELGGTD